MKKIVFSFTLLVLSQVLFALPWQPGQGHHQVPIWPTGKMPDVLKNTKPEFAEKITKPLVAGKPWVAVNNVSKPAMTVYQPKGKNSGAAVIVFPGGGFRVLAIDLEGTEICRWFTAQGMTCVLLKYRVPFSGPASYKSCHCHI